MKRLNLLLLLVFLLIASSAFAAPYGGYRPTNTATKVCGEIFDSTTAKVIAAAVTGIDCEVSRSNSTTNAGAFTDLTTAETVVGALGQFCADVTAAEMNITDGEFTIKCSASNANATDYIVKFSTRKDVIADDGIGPKAQTFDGATLAESGSTLDLEANEISVDNQFVGDRISLFTAATGVYYGSSCIVASSNANERITTEDNLSALHTVGDKYVIRPDSACSITASKIQTGAIGASELAAGAITNATFAAGAIDVNALAAGAITNAKLASGAITAATLATDAIGATQLASDATLEIINGIFAKTVNAVTALPTDGPETFEKIVRSIYQRFFHKVVDNGPQNERQIYQTGGVTKWCESTTSASGGVFTNGVCGAVD